MDNTLTIKKIICNAGTESLARCGSELVRMDLLTHDQMRRWTDLDEKYYADVMELLELE